LRRGRDFQPRQARRRDAGLGRRTSRTTAKIQQAMAAAGGRRRLAAAEEASHRGRKGTAAPSRRPKKPGKPAAPPSTNLIQVARNFTDPEAGIMKSKDGFVQATSQAAVDAGAQIIVAQRTDAVRQRSGPVGAADQGHREQSRPQAGSGLADSGYCSESNLEALEAHGIDGYVAPDAPSTRTGANGKIADATQRSEEDRRRRLRNTLRLRKQVVEPVVRQIKQARASARSSRRMA